MDIQGKIHEIKNLGSGYYFTHEMQILAEKTASGDEISLQILSHMTEECRDPLFWKDNCKYCSTALAALAHARTGKTLQILTHFIKNLSEEMPYGAVDLLGSLLTEYKNLIVGPLKEMADNPLNAAQKAIGLHALCNMALDDELCEEDLNFLMKILIEFHGDRYFSSDFVDTAVSHIKNKLKQYEMHEDLLDSILA